MADRPLLLMHFGFHKTGTTSLQHMLRLNIARLPPDLLVLVNPNPLTRNLGNACRELDRHPGARGEQSVRTAWQEIVEAVLESGRPRVLLSTENILGRIPSPGVHRHGELYPHAARILQIILDASERVDLRPALYVRDADAWTKSLHGHLVRTRALGASLQRFRQTAALQDISLAQIAERLAVQAGCSISTYRFEDDLGTSPGLGTQLLREIGLSDAELCDLEPAPPRNEGFAADFVAFATAPPVSLLSRPLRHIALWGYRRGWFGAK